MLMIFVDETSDSKFKDYFGISVATINYTKYPTIKSEFQNILKSSNWNESIEFKGSCLFSIKAGDTNVSIDERIEIAEKIIDLNIAKKNARINFYYLKHTVKPENQSSEYLRLFPNLLKKVLPKAPSGPGKNLVSIHFDYRSDLDIRVLKEAVTPVMNEKGFIIFEEPLMINSNFNTVGLIYADIIGYLAARIDTISNDSELFEGLLPEHFSTNGKIKKLRSSVNLIAKVKNIGQYEIKIKKEPHNKKMHPTT